jgi:MFS family permease
MGLRQSLPASQVLVAESVGLDYGKMKIAYSIVFLFSNIPAVFTSFLGGVMADSSGYYTVFAAAVSLEALNFVLYSSRLKETISSIELSSSFSKNREETLPLLRGILNRLVSALNPPPGSWKYFGTFAMDSFASVSLDT